MGLLSQQGIDTALKDLDVEWGVVAGTTLTRVFNFRNFRDALSFTDKIGKLAEEKNHHPQIILEWGKVELHITTHSEGGITDKDIDLAAQIDKLK